MKKNYITFLLFFCVAFSYAQSGTSLSFDGVDDGINLTSIDFPLGNAPRTIEVKIKTTQSNAGSAIITYGNPAQGNGRFALYQTQGKFNFVAEYNDLLTTKVINDGAWHHLAVAFDGAELKLYVDGELVGAKTTTLNTVSFEHSIGFRGNSEPREFFEGAIDELRIWGDARTEEEIKANMANELTLPQSNLISYYKFNDGEANGDNSSVATLTDELNKNNGALQNFDLSGTSSNWTNEGTLSNSEVSINSKFIRLYPNPSNDFIQVSGINKNVKYSIYNVLGNEVKKGNISIGEQLDITNLSKGIYLLKLNTNLIKFVKE